MAAVMSICRQRRHYQQYRHRGTDARQALDIPAGFLVARRRNACAAGCEEKRAVGGLWARGGISAPPLAQRDK